MKLFVCGSCSITDKEWIFSKIEECVSENNFTDITVLEGEAKGVDLIAKEWAVARGIPVKEYPPDVKRYLHNACHKRKSIKSRTKFVCTQLNRILNPFGSFWKTAKRFFALPKICELCIQNSGKRFLSIYWKRRMEGLEF